MITRRCIAVAIVACVLCTNITFAGRVKDIATIEGVTGVQVVGYGLVTGLSNTGDSQLSGFTVQSIINMLKRFGVTPQNINLRTRNVAAVMVTATIPVFMKKGAKLDVQISSAGDAESLQGGVLLMTPLSGTDGAFYGFAQGPISVGGYDYRMLGSRTGRNSTTSGRVPSGCILDKNVEGTIVNNSQIRVLLRDPDFTTATRVADAINKLPNLTNAAQAVDGGTIAVTVPAGSTQQQIMSFIAQIEAANVSVDVAGRVVINERTGTIVVGGNVQLSPSVVAHGGIEIQIQRTSAVQQPAPFTFGRTQRTDNATLVAREEKNPPVVVPATTTVQDMANALTQLKVAPRDLIAIFQALKEAGSLQGELIIQ